MDNTQEQSLLAKSSFELWMITATVMLVTIIEVLDMTIVNVTLPSMMGDLGASMDQITWVLTSYIVSAAIFMVLTGFLVNRIGRKRLLIYNILGFLIASILCGMSSNLAEIVFFRTLQGIFGAGLVPLSQTILQQTYKKEQLGTAMAIWGIGVMVAPVLGPTLGGYITDHLSWRWVFYINIPICTLSLFMAMQFIKETPKVLESIDWFGMFLMAMGVGSLQIFLDRGNNSDWFQSNSIIVLAVISVIFLTMFIMRGARKKDNIINLKIFLNRNFSLATVMLAAFCAGMIGILSIQPLLLQQFMGYPAELTGLIMAPRGIASAISMFLVSGLITRFDPRKIMFIGILITICGIYIMSGYNLETSNIYWIWTGFIQGFGMGFFFVPLTTISLSTLSEDQVAEGTGLFSFGRNLGISIGISLLTTLLTRESQINWNRLGGHINVFNNNLHTWLNARDLSISSPQAVAELSRQLSQQSGMIAFIDSFWLVAILLIALLPCIFLLKRPENTQAK